jgi:possible phage associated protein
MGAIFGGGGTVSTADTRIGSLAISQSTYGIAIPVVFGTARVAGNMIDYIDFTAIPHTTTTRSGGKGGGGVTSSHTTYTYEVAAIFALCEGEVKGVKRVWKNKEVHTKLEDLRMSVYTGAASQAPWPWMVGKHPERALSYPQTCYVASPNLELSSSATVPAFNYEVAGRDIAPGKQDAAPISIIRGILSDRQIGVGFPVQYLADTTQFEHYCVVNGIYFSPAYDSQKEAHELISALLEAANAAPVWSQGKLKIVPYGLMKQTANGVIYTPPKAPLYDITHDDLVYTEGETPITIRPNLTTDRYNVQPVEILNRRNDYNVEPIKATDDADISQRGIRTADSIEMHFITEPDVAAFAAQAILQRKLYIAAQYEFTLSWRHCLLDPMDVVTLTDEILGLDHHPVRILTIEEDEALNLKITAEDCPDGINSPTVYTTQTAQRPKMDYNIASGSVVRPVVFNPPPEMTATGFETWIATSGDSPNWGGCTVWVSTDGSTYKSVGKVDSPARRGELLGELPIGMAADEKNALHVRLFSGDELLSGTWDDAEAYRTACYVDGEIIAYRRAKLTDVRTYELSPLRRGGYGSLIGAHPTGSTFVRLDAAVFKYPYETSDLGKKIYLKFTSFNIYGTAEESLAEVEAYEHTLNCPMPQEVANITLDEDTYRLRDGTVLSDVLVAFQGTSKGLVRGYNIYYELNKSGSWQFSGTAADGDYRIKALPQAQHVRVKVTTVTKYGVESAGAVSDEITLVGKSAPPPDVTGLHLRQNPYNREEVLLTWDDLTLSDIPDLRGYEIRLGDSGWGNAKKLNGDPVFRNEFSHIVKADGSYTYRIKALDNSGNYSVNDTYVTEQIRVVPDAVTDLKAVQSKQDRSKAVISFIPSPGEDIARYIIKQGDDWKTGTLIVATKETAHAWSVPASGTYNIMVQAVTIAGQVSPIANVSITITIEPLDVTGFRAAQSRTDKSVVRLSWDTVSDADTAYYIVKEGDTWETGRVIAPRISGVYYDLKITEERILSWMIKAVTIAGHESQYAASLSSVFSLNPSPVRDFQCRQAEDDRSRLMLQWSRVEDGDLKGYEVRIGDAWETSEALPLTGELYASYKMQESRSIRIMIKALNAAGYYSDETSISYQAKLEPADIQNLKAFQNGDKVELYWDIPKEKDIAGYEIHEGNSWENGQVVAIGVLMPSYVAEIDTCRSYRYTVKAVNKAGHYSTLAAAVTITITELMPKNIIQSYDELTAANGVHEGTEYAKSSINWQTIGGRFSDYPKVRFADAGGGNVLRLKKTGAGYAKTGIYTCKTIDVGSVITANITTTFNNTAVFRDNGSISLEVRTSQDGNVWIDWNIFKPLQFTFRYVQFRIRMSGDGTRSPEVSRFVVQIDVPDTDISTSAKVVRGGSRVAYGHTYYTVPVVIPAAIGEGLHAELISKTKTDCMIKVKDRNNNDVGGNVDIRIKGY